MEEEIFECQQCGYCCQGETTVSLDDNDVKRMVDYLDMPFEEVKEKYFRVTGNVTQMKTEDGHCIFYDNGCTVHPGRPWRCAQWPLHPSILGDRSNYQPISGSCPGIKNELGYDEFCRKLKVILDKKNV
ncbi:MAG: YkgJ family cysteine cluster protein [Proteobacteria bacterium]|nr:YkgJ family cysteine cluster protein [Pseudomonadota bacterium]MBU1709265.1 YkgJ family cysteine cluster protein [Pseudomonadota bacterium]